MHIAPARREGRNVRGAEKGGMAVVDTPAWISRDGEARALTPPAQTIAQFANRALAR
jgi:hypothetical protein